MLHKETVKPGTLDLIHRLMRDPYFRSFYLVGGTALALKLGHRESIDIDLFNSSDFNADILVKHLQKEYGAIIKRYKNNYISGNIRQVDFDLITHQYPSVKALEVVQGIRMMSMEDIAAMKVNAIVNSGNRIKDFIDIHYLLREFAMSDIINCYCQKYPNVNADMARSSLLYHEDIDFNVPVKLRDNKLRWQDVERSIIAAISAFDRQRSNDNDLDDENDRGYSFSR
ncbi:MAG: nucleotidyl transferase AbiEii/AbiGii toxin family protein [Bacteroidetes bacterium]|nr:nucleotidyl transferase AbiEii/AbiGii toxin family protein [Bacteroidota bacterium]